MSQVGRYTSPGDKSPDAAGWHPSANGVVTERDLAMVSWISRFPCVTIDLLRRWLVDVASGGQAESIVYTRLRLLERAGLVRSERVLAAASRAVWCTTDGLRAAGQLGRATPPRVGSFEHDLMVAWLALEFTVSKPTHKLVTEREMKGFETPNQSYEPRPVFTTPAETGQRRVYPDLVTISPSGAHVVHEVERTAKERRRLERLMLAHLSNPHVASVRYYARAGAVLDRLEVAAGSVRGIAGQRGIVKPLSVVTYEGQVS